MSRFVKPTPPMKKKKTDTTKVAKKATARKVTKKATTSTPRKRAKTKAKKEQGTSLNDIILTVIFVGSIGYLLLVKLWVSM